MSPRTYHYHAVDAEGAKQTGTMLSSSQAVVVEALYRRGWVPLEIAFAPRRAAARPWGWESLWKAREKVSARELLIFFQALSVLLEAGLTVDRALQINGGMGRSPPLRRLNSHLLKSVRSGQTLSLAFQTFDQRLPPFMRSMIEAGEVGGALPQTLARIAELQGSQLEMKERVRSALVYPALLGGVVLITLILLLTLVLPRFEVLFAESPQQIPWSTRAVLGTGRFVADYWWALLGMVLVSSGSLYSWLHTPHGRRRFDGWALRTSLSLGLPKSLNAARFLRTTGTLCRNGATLPSALRIARGTLSNARLDEAVGQIIAGVQAGNPLSQGLASSRLFPEVAVQLTRVGEESGQLDALLISSAKVLEEDSQLKLDRLLTLLVPSLTIGMGMIVAALISSVLVGLLSINDLAI